MKLIDDNDRFGVNGSAVKKKDFVRLRSTGLTMRITSSGL